MNTQTKHLSMSRCVNVNKSIKYTYMIRMYAWQQNPPAQKKSRSHTHTRTRAQTNKQTCLINKRRQLRRIEKRKTVWGKPKGSQPIKREPQTPHPLHRPKRNNRNIDQSISEDVFGRLFKICWRCDSSVEGKSLSLDARMTNGHMYIQHVCIPHAQFHERLRWTGFFMKWSPHGDHSQIHVHVSISNSLKYSNHFLNTCTRYCTGISCGPGSRQSVVENSALIDTVFGNRWLEVCLHWSISREMGTYLKECRDCSICTRGKVTHAQDCMANGIYTSGATIFEQHTWNQSKTYH